jgi:hypothetical protein
VNLFRQLEDKTGAPIMEAVGGAGVTDVIRINDQDPKSNKKRLITVGFVNVTYLSLLILTRRLEFQRTYYFAGALSHLFPSHRWYFIGTHQYI